MATRETNWGRLSTRVWPLALREVADGLDDDSERLRQEPYAYYRLSPALTRILRPNSNGWRHIDVCAVSV